MVMFSEQSQTTGSIVPFAAIREAREWAEWQALTRDAPPFLTPEFFALNQPLAGDGEPLIACARGTDGLVGILPLQRRGHTIEGLRSNHTPDFDYAGDATGLDAIWRTLRGDRRWSTLVLKSVPRDSTLALRLPELASADGCVVVSRPGDRHPYLSLGSFEAHMNPHFRANLRRCERKAGGVTLERLTAPTRADLEEALHIEEMAWKGNAGTSITADARTRHLYHALVRLFGRRGQASLYFLRAGGQRLAMLLAVEAGQTIYALKIGYHPGAAGLSPGHLLVWKVAAEAEGRGLLGLNFVGREDAWKRKWTSEAREHVTLVFYNRTVRGRTLHALRETVAPFARTLVSDMRTPLQHGCQRDDIIGTHTSLERVQGRLREGLGIKSGVVRAFSKRGPARPALGVPSRFAPGSWVRVRAEAQIRATLDDRSRLKGLEFTQLQWATCDRVYRVAKHVRRIRDDHGVFRAIGRTVLLEGVTCAGEGKTPAGCGRHCPMMYRDDWLEPAEVPRRTPKAASQRSRARVRDVSEILPGLDLFGRRDGISFMPRMADFAGKRVEVAECLTRVFEHDRWVETRARVYILDGVHCDGAAAGRKGPCDRACALLWHADWLMVEPQGVPEGGAEGSAES